jgi:hypothetical protein
LPRPSYQHVANIAIVAIEFGGAGDSEAIRSEPAANDLSRIVQQAYPRCARATCVVIQSDGDGIAFDRVDVDAVSHQSRETLAGDASTDNDRVGGGLLNGTGSTVLPVCPPVLYNTLSSRHYAIHHSIAIETHTTPLADKSQLAGKFVNVASRIRRSEEPTIEFALNSRFDAFHFLRGDRVALYAAPL